MKALLLPVLLALAACAAPGAHMPARASGEVTVPYAAAGLEAVIGQDAAGLVRRFGQPGADVREGAGRKLQFAGPICVLDAYLYPHGAAEPRVTYVDARQPDGTPIDRSSCAAALLRRDGGR